MRLVTKPQAAYRVSLEAGRYNISLWNAGSIVPGTERQLDVIDVAGRATLVGDVIPEERWTRPLGTNSEAARIYAKPGATFYLTVADATRFDESEYLPIINPQAQPIAGRSMWVRRKTSDARLLHFEAEEAVREVSRKQLKVEQKQGSGFGYRVRDARDGETPDLEAFVVTLPSNAGAQRLSVSIPGADFQREIVMVQPRNSGWGLALALLPAIAGFAAWLARRRSSALRN